MSVTERSVAATLLVSMVSPSTLASVLLGGPTEAMTHCVKVCPLALFAFRNDQVGREINQNQNA